MVNKVLAYITRQKAGRNQLLVFDHRHSPKAGSQVPAGTVEAGEPLEDALWREVEEESGLVRAQLRLIAKLAEYENNGGAIRRHVFHLAVDAPVPDVWTKVVTGAGSDKGLVFDYHWIDLAKGLELAGNQHAWLDRIQLA